MSRGTTLPAICRECGTPFDSGVHLNGIAMMSANRTGPCPQCGGWGDLPEGVISATNGLWKVLRDDDEAAREVRQAVTVLQSASKDPHPRREDVEQELQSRSPKTAPWIVRMLRDPAFANLTKALSVVGRILEALLGG